MTFFDAVVICFDVGDETTLEAAVAKVRASTGDEPPKREPGKTDQPR